MHLSDIINTHRSIIVLNGQLPHEQLIKTLNSNVPVIAADGAAANLVNSLLQPTLIVGDGDSYVQNNSNQSNPTFIHIADQDTTDFEKCMFFAKTNNLLPSLVLGINGGEIDHIVGNIQMLARHADGQNFYFLDSYTKGSSFGLKLGLPLNKQQITLQLQPGQTISFISFHEAIMQTHGLEWELCNQPLSIDGILSLRNRSKQATVGFELKHGKVVAVVDITGLWPTSQT